MGKVMFITDSILSEQPFLDGIDKLHQASIDIEATILPVNCTPRDLEKCVTRAKADVFIVGSSKAKILSSFVAAYTEKPVIGVRLKSGIIGGLNAIYTFKEPPNSSPFRIADESDIKVVISEAQKIAS